MEESREGMNSAIMDLHPSFRVILGIAICALAATYGILLLIAIMGWWRNNLLHTAENLIIAAIIALGSVIGQAARRIWVGNTIVGAGLFVYCAMLFAITRDTSDFNFMG